MNEILQSADKLISFNPVEQKRVNRNEHGKRLISSLEMC